MKPFYILIPRRLFSLLLACLSMGLFWSCEDFALPQEGSLADQTPPLADFTFAPNDGDYRTIHFNNQSISATDYLWEFGDGTTSAERDPVHTYSADGTFEVSLTASDKLNVSNRYATTIEVIEPDDPFEPVILNPGFDIEGEDSYRDHWRNGDLGGVIQITSSPVHDGEKAAKLPSAGDRIGYQLITVQPNKDYVVSFYYTMKTSPEGSLTVSILAGDVRDPDEIEAATLASVTVSDQTDSGTYILEQVVFNSGDNTEVAIYFTNREVESRVDSFTIVEN